MDADKAHDEIPYSLLEMNKIKKYLQAKWNSSEFS